LQASSTLEGSGSCCLCSKTSRVRVIEPRATHKPKSCNGITAFIIAVCLNRNELVLQRFGPMLEGQHRLQTMSVEDVDGICKKSGPQPAYPFTQLWAYCCVKSYYPDVHGPVNAWLRYNAPGKPCHYYAKKRHDTNNRYPVIRNGHRGGFEKQPERALLQDQSRSQNQRPAGPCELMFLSKMEDNVALMR